MNKRARLILMVGFILIICLGGLLFATGLTWYPFMWILLVGGLFGILTWTLMERRLILDFLTTRSSKNGISMGALIGAVICLLVAINFLSTRYSKTFDLSLTQQFTLSDQSKKIMDSLSEKLEVIYFYQEGLENVEKDKKAFARLAKIFQDYSRHVSLKFVEINSKPSLVKEFGATRPSGEPFVSYKSRKIRIEGLTEQDFVNAIIKVTRETFKTIYFISGHNERMIDQEKNSLSISSFANLIQKNAFKVVSINLFETGKIPDDASVVIIAGATEKFQKNEIVVLEDYLKNGGKILLFLENKFDAGLRPLLDQLGIEMQNFFVANVFNSQVGSVVDLNQPTIGVQFAAEHQITRMFTQNNGVSFLQPGSFIVKQNSATIKGDILVQTPQASVALAELASTDYIGKPQAFALAVESSGTFSTSKSFFKVIAFSDVDVISNSLLFQRSNKDLMLNAVSYLAGETDLVAIAPKNPQISNILMKEPEFAHLFKMTLVGVFIPIPFLFLIVSGLLWLRRKNA
jgi:ABC-type uncharacterized transport system involved in gliding motility auxiliary subunit